MKHQTGYKQFQGSHFDKDQPLNLSSQDVIKWPLQELLRYKQAAKEIIEYMNNEFRTLYRVIYSPSCNSNLPNILRAG